MCFLANREPSLHQAVSEVDLVEVDLEGDEEECVPEHGIGIALENGSIVVIMIYSY